MNKHKFQSVERVNKTVAKRLYNEGKELIIVPCKFIPDLFSSNSMAMVISTKDYDDLEEWPFEKRINAFEYYNCNYETGYYTAFYKWI